MPQQNQRRNNRPSAPRCPYCIAAGKGDPNPLPFGRDACLECRPDYDISGRIVDWGGGQYVLVVHTTKNHTLTNMSFLLETEGTTPRLADKNDGVSFVDSGIAHVVLLPGEEEKDFTVTLYGVGTDMPGKKISGIGKKAKSTKPGLDLTAEILNVGNDNYQIIVQTYEDGIQAPVAFVYHIDDAKPVTVLENDSGFFRGVRFIKVKATARERQATFHIVGRNADSKKLDIPGCKVKEEKFKWVPVVHGIGFIGNVVKAYKGE